MSFAFFKHILPLSHTTVINNSEKMKYYFHQNPKQHIGYDFDKMPKPETSIKQHYVDKFEEGKLPSMGS